MGKIIREKISKDNENEFFEYRKKYVNASEIGVIMGLSKYQVAADLFCKKIGLIDENRTGNKFTVYGQLMEDAIAELWSYYDLHEPDAYIDNFKNKFKIRHCEKKNGSLRNTDFPYLSCSLDRIIKKGNVNLLTGEELEKDSPLELKTIDKYLMMNWESQIPPIYLMQLHQQMLITETYYGEVFLSSSDREFHLFPVEYRMELGNAIKEHGLLFINLVEKGRELKEMYDLAMLDNKKKEADDIMHEIDRLIPLPSSGQEELYKKFLGEKFKDTDKMASILGDKDQLRLAREVIYLQDLEKEVKALCEGKKNIIRQFMGKVEVMNFENTDFSINWKADKNGNRVFRASKKEEVSSRSELIQFCESFGIDIQKTF